MAKISEFDNFGVEDLGPDDFKTKQAAILEKCKCSDCPTYVEGDNPRGYCFPVFGTSDNIKHEKECICSTCPVYSEYELSHTFYCTRCSQLCQAYKAEVGGGHE